MSIKKVAAFFLIVFPVLGLALYQTHVASNLVSELVSDLAPDRFAPSFNRSQFTSRGVVDRIIQLKIESQNNRDVIATVSVPFDVETELHYKWTLGQNVVLKTGALEGITNKNLRKSTNIEIKINVEGYTSSELRHIGFEIWGDKNGRRIYADGLISSQKEKSFEKMVQRMGYMKAKKSGDL